MASISVGLWLVRLNAKLLLPPPLAAGLQGTEPPPVASRLDPAAGAPAASDVAAPTLMLMLRGDAKEGLEALSSLVRTATCFSASTLQLQRGMN